MKRNLLIACTSVAFIFASCGESKPETPKAPITALTGDAKLTVDPSASKVAWEGTMLGLYSHSGLVTLKSGTVSLKDGKVMGGSFVIDMNSITPTDGNYTEPDGHTAANLVGHLSSPDFFDTASSPEASFVITSVNGNTVNGNLTVRGKTNPEALEISTVALEGENVKLNGTLKFDRQKYGVAFSMPVKDKVLSDEIAMNIELVGKK